jgi:hypothetical protein
MVNTRNSQCNG